nr:MAG TPA: hypothetical protein [Caudoviricetes sp.]
MYSVRENRYKVNLIIIIVFFLRFARIEVFYLECSIKTI